MIARLRSHTGLSSGTIALGEVTTLDHEVLDDTVEAGTLITETLFASCQSSEVLGCQRSGLAVEAHDDASQGLVAVANIEVDLVCNLRALDGLGGLCEVDKNDGEDE